MQLEIQQDPITPLAIIRKDLLAITGNKTQAMILNQLIYWSEKTRDYISYQQEEMLRAGGHDTGLTHGWIHRTMEQLGEEIFICAKTVSRNIRQLIKKGLIAIKKGTTNKWDQTTLYRVDKKAIESQLSASNPHVREQDTLSTSNQTVCPHRTGQDVRLSKSILENNIESNTKTPLPPKGVVSAPEVLPLIFSAEEIQSPIKQVEQATKDQDQDQDQGQETKAPLLEQPNPEKTPNPLSEAPLPPRRAAMWDEQGFEEFWANYPRKVSKEQAKKAWNRLKPDGALKDEMLRAVAFQKQNWTEARYTPHAATWLNGRRWEDELQPVKQALTQQVKRAEGGQAAKDVLAKYRERMAS